MAKKIDGTMSQIYRTALQKGRQEGESITEHEAMLLIKRADEINHKRSFFFSSQKCRGNKYLTRLMNANQSKFTLDSQRLIHSYVHSGQIPSLEINHAYTVAEEDRDARRMVGFPERQPSAHGSHATDITSGDSSDSSTDE